MNIFFTDRNPVTAARNLCNKHVIKMILEVAQLLCAAHIMTESKLRPEEDIKFYKLTHGNHPCSIWARSSLRNYDWLSEHGMSLCDEYTFRYGKEHATQKLMWWLYTHAPNIAGVDFTNPPLCMPDIYKTDDPVESYRNYYRLDKMKNIECIWTRREQPLWITQ